MAQSIGDIVTIAGQTGNWVVQSQAGVATPPGYRCVNPNAETGNAELVVEGSQLTTVLAAPSLTPGMTVRLPDGGRADVVEDLGETVRVSRSNRVPLSHGHLSWDGEGVIGKGALVAQNLSLFI